MARTNRSKTPPAILPRVMPFKEAARETGFSYESLRDAHFRGQLAIVRFNRAWYVEVSELARFVADHTERRERSA